MKAPATYFLLLPLLALLSLAACQRNDAEPREPNVLVPGGNLFYFVDGVDSTAKIKRLHLFDGWYRLNEFSRAEETATEFKIETEGRKPVPYGYLSGLAYGFLEIARPKNNPNLAWLRADKIPMRQDWPRNVYAVDSAYFRRETDALFSQPFTIVSHNRYRLDLRREINGQTHRLLLQSGWYWGD